MARETRRQRRDARRAAGEQASAAPRPRRQPAEPAAAADGGAAGGGWSGGVSDSGAFTAPPLAQRAGRRRRLSFIRESVGELKKVEWPGRPQVVQGTVVVLIACAIVGAFLYAADQALRPFVQHVLLGQ